MATSARPIVTRQASIEVVVLHTTVSDESVSWCWKSSRTLYLFINPMCRSHTPGVISARLPRTLPSKPALISIWSATPKK